MLFLIETIQRYQFRSNYLSTKKSFSQFFAAILKSRLNFEYFEKQTTLTAFVFAKLWTLKSWLKKCLKNHVSENLFDKQHGKRAEGRFKSVAQILYHIHRPHPSKLSWTKSLFLTCKVLRLLANTLTAGEKYLVLNKDNLWIPIKMHISQNKKNFS